MLLPVQYHSRKYPDHIKPEIKEIAGHFDTKKIITDEDLISIINDIENVGITIG